ncbi:MAG: metallopeptidase family protein, partial [Kiritimatiellaeota bacterium]|nr:metallopeptidase family protein [Kiritimatiellota bacterium]
ERAQSIPVTFESAPSRAMLAAGLEPDTLGLFIGEEYPESAAGGAALPAQILLFLDTLWAYAEGDPFVFRREVRKTVLHELGHYLGLDEHDLAVRRLD